MQVRKCDASGSTSANAQVRRIWVDLSEGQRCLTTRLTALN
jgi:hypothetical protein